MEPKDLMYIILGEEQIALTLWYRRGVGTLIIYPIIIADIAPRIPGGLTHFNWPRLLCDRPVHRVYHKSCHIMVQYVHSVCNRKCEK